MVNNRKLFYWRSIVATTCVVIIIDVTVIIITKAHNQKSFLYFNLQCLYILHLNFVSLLQSLGSK